MSNGRASYFGRATKANLSASHPPINNVDFTLVKALEHFVHQMITLKIGWKPVMDKLAVIWQHQN